MIVKFKVVLEILFFFENVEKQFLMMLVTKDFEIKVSLVVGVVQKVLILISEGFIQGLSEKSVVVKFIGQF